MTRIIMADEVRRMHGPHHLANTILYQDCFQDQDDPIHHGVRYATGEAADAIETSFALTFGYEDCPAAGLDSIEREWPQAEDE